MEQGKTYNKTKINYWINISSFLPFLLLAFTGLMLQLNYHMGRKPDYYEVLSLNRYEWLLVHKILAVVSTLIIIIHLVLHYKWIMNLVRKKIPSKGVARTTKYLIVIYSLAVLTGIISWIFISDPHSKRGLVELHDKITLFLVVFFILHIIQHFKWLIKNTKKNFLGENMLKTSERILNIKKNRERTKFVWFDKKVCKACWKCIEKCQQKVIGRINLPWHKHARINNPDKCTGCLKCVKVCEQNALIKI